MKTKVIKKVLMCRPLYFSSLNYSINPWMKPGSIDEEKSKKEWKKLYEVYKNLDIEVEVLDQQPDAPDMVFTTDQGIVNGKKVLLSRFKHKERRRESDYFRKWFLENGYIVNNLPEDIYFEGNGETFFWQDRMFLGVGYRSDKKTASFMSKFFDREVITLELVNPFFFHLDVALFPLNKDTIFYYPQAFSKLSREKLTKIVPNLIPFTNEEANGFCGNSITTDHHVVCQKGNPTFEKKLKKLGYKPVPVHLGEFIKSGGGAHCLTNILKEGYQN